MVVKIILLCVLGTGGLGPERCAELGREAKARYEQEAGIRLRYLQIRAIRDPFSDRNGILPPNLSEGSRAAVLQMWQGFVRRRYRFHSNRIYGVLLPPLLVMGQAYLTGMAANGCYRDRFGPTVFYARAKEQGAQNGADYFMVSRIGFMHELGHSLGASHEGIVVDDATCNIMHADGYRCGINFGEQHFKTESIEQMRRCVR